MEHNLKNPNIGNSFELHYCCNLKNILSNPNLWLIVNKLQLFQMQEKKRDKGGDKCQTSAHKIRQAKDSLISFQYIYIYIYLSYNSFLEPYWSLKQLKLDCITSANAVLVVPGCLGQIGLIFSFYFMLDEKCIGSFEYLYTIKLFWCGRWLNVIRKTFIFKKVSW